MQHKIIFSHCKSKTIGNKTNIEDNEQSLRFESYIKYEIIEEQSGCSLLF